MSSPLPAFLFLLYTLLTVLGWSLHGVDSAILCPASWALTVFLLGSWILRLYGQQVTTAAAYLDDKAKAIQAALQEHIKTIGGKKAIILQRENEIGRLNARYDYYATIIVRAKSAKVDAEEGAEIEIRKAKWYWYRYFSAAQDVAAAGLAATVAAPVAEESGESEKLKKEIERLKAANSLQASTIDTQTAELSTKTEEIKNLQLLPQQQQQQPQQQQISPEAQAQLQQVQTTLDTTAAALAEEKKLVAAMRAAYDGEIATQTASLRTQAREYVAAREAEMASQRASQPSQDNSKLAIEFAEKLAAKERQCAAETAAAASQLRTRLEKERNEKLAEKEKWIESRIQAATGEEFVRMEKVNKDEKDGIALLQVRMNVLEGELRDARSDIRMRDRTIRKLKGEPEP